MKLYAEQVSEEELLDIKLLISMYYAQRAIAAADKAWEEKNLSDKVMQQWSKKKMLFSSPPSASRIGSFGYCS